jgi:hypothetical protein
MAATRSWPWIILGYTEVGTTLKYLHLLTKDLQRPHQGLSILNQFQTRDPDL